MDIILNCKKCGEAIKADSRDVGKEGECPSCGESVLIRTPGKEAPDGPKPPPIPPPTPIAAMSGPAQTLPAAPTPVKETSGLAIASLVCGILSLFTVMFGGIILAIVGIILSKCARNNIRRQPERWNGNGLAVAGLITSIVGLAVAVVMMLLVGTVMAAAGALMNEMFKGIQAAQPH
jgi:DNA-directed RNA polymerase subunit RPC12/RpoP